MKKGGWILTTMLRQICKCANPKKTNTYEYSIKGECSSNHPLVPTCNCSRGQKFEASLCDAEVKTAKIPTASMEHKEE